MAICERCQAEIRDGYCYPPGVDPERGKIVVDGETRHLSPTYVDLLEILWTRRGTYVHRDTLIRLLWGMTAKRLSAPESNLRESMRQTRFRIAGAPFTIVTDHKRGWMIVESGMTCKAA